MATVARAPRHSPHTSRPAHVVIGALSLQVDAELELRRREDAEEAERYFRTVVLVAFVSEARGVCGGGWVREGGKVAARPRGGRERSTHTTTTGFTVLSLSPCHPLQRKRMIARRLRRWYLLAKAAKAEAAKAARKRAAAKPPSATAGGKKGAAVTKKK